MRPHKSDGFLLAALLASFVACKGSAGQAADAAPPESSAALASSSAGGLASTAPPDDKLLGFPPDAACADAKKTLAQPENNELEMNEHAGARATLAACAMRLAFTALRTSLSPGAASALDAAQAAWETFSVERENERFPHSAEQGYYGSIAGMCYGALDEESATARTAELKALAKACGEAASDAPQATRAAKGADATLNEVYRKIRATYETDATFIKALTHAQVIWLKLRDSQVTLAKARTDDNPACAESELARVTSARVDQLRAWLKPTTEGDTCIGSYGGPSPTTPSGVPGASGGGTSPVAPGPVDPMGLCKQLESAGAATRCTSSRPAGTVWQGATTAVSFVSPADPKKLGMIYGYASSAGIEPVRDFFCNPEMSGMAGDLYVKNNMMVVSFSEPYPNETQAVRTVALTALLTRSHVFENGRCRYTQ